MSYETTVKVRYRDDGSMVFFWREPGGDEVEVELDLDEATDDES